MKPFLLILLIGWVLNCSCQQSPADKKKEATEILLDQINRDYNRDTNPRKIDWDTVKSAILAGADVNVKNKYGETALYAAVNYVKEDIVKLLLERRADVKASPNALITAIKTVKPELVKMLLDHGADINAISTDEDGETVMTQAADYGNIEIAQLLHDRGADVNARNKKGWTPLMIATFSDYIQFSEFLLKNGANVNAKRKDGETALSLARTPEVEELLRSYGAKE